MNELIPWLLAPCFMWVAWRLIQAKEAGKVYEMRERLLSEARSDVEKIEARGGDSTKARERVAYFEEKLNPTAPTP